MTSPSTVAGRHSPDALRDGLVALCRALDRTVTRQMLGDGLPLNNGRLPVNMVPRALRRLDISASVDYRSPDSIPDRLLPALLLLNDDTTVLLLGVHDNEARVRIPEVEDSEEHWPLDELREQHDGRVILARARPCSDERAGDFARKRPEHWLKGPLRACRSAYLEVGLAAMMANLLAIATALFAMQVYDRVVPNAAFDTLWILASGVMMALLLEFMLRGLRGHLLEVIGKKLDLKLSSILFEQAMRLKLTARPPSTGAFSSQIREFESVREFFTSTTAAAISDVPFALIFVVIIGFLGGWQIAMVPAAVMALMMTTGLLAQRPLGRLSRENLREGAVRNGLLLEAIEHPETVKAVRAEGRHLDLYERLSDQLSSSAIRQRNISNLLGSGATMLQQMGYVGVIIMGVYMITSGELTVGALIACSILSSRAIAPMTRVTTILARWQHVRVALEGLNNMMSAPVEREAHRVHVPLRALAGRYTLDDIQVKYQPDAAAVLQINHLAIEAGTHVALLGGNGSGKSTLLRVLSGLIEPSSGRVMLDDLNLAQIEPADRRRAIGYLPQDVALFHGTLRDNLTMDGEAYSDVELFHALDGVQLGGFVRHHPLGLDLPIASSKSLSGGQRQAIGLARLILQDPMVVLMDEPTAAYDQSSEKRVIEFLKTWLESRTVIVATHRRSLLTLTTEAIVLQQGQLSRHGPLEGLVQGHQVNSGHEEKRA